MNLVISVCVVLSLLCGLSVQDLLVGPCSRFQVSNVRPFSQKWLKGVWYLYRTYDANLSLHSNDCITFIHRLRPDGNIKTTEISKNLQTNTATYGKSDMIFNIKNEGHYLYQTAEGVSEPTQIVARGFGYYIEFNCVDQDFPSCYLGIFTSSPFPDDFTKSQIDEFLVASKIGSDNIRNVNHVDCKINRSHVNSMNKNR